MQYPVPCNARSTSSIIKDGKQLTWQLFSFNRITILQKMKINASQYNTHSFYIGATASAKVAGISEAHIQMLGRWKNQAYLQYISTPRSQLAMLSKWLVQGHTVWQLDWSTCAYCIVGKFGRKEVWQEGSLAGRKFSELTLWAFGKRIKFGEL